MDARGPYYVLTGPRNSGKSLICNELVAEAHARGMDVAGILTGPSDPEPAAPREVVDLRSGASRLFGMPSTLGSDPLAPRWALEEDVFEWGNEVLTEAVPCDLLIIDEVGPLELKGGRGWVAALDILEAGDFRAALVVCRPDLLDSLETRLGRPPAATFEADPDESDRLPDLILQQMFGQV